MSSADPPATADVSGIGAPTLTVIVPVRDGARHLAACLASVEADPYAVGRRTILVADNGSADGSAALAASLGAGVMSISDIRVSELRNRAAGQATTDLLAFVDVDHEVAPGWARAAVATLTDASVGAVGAPYHSPPDPTWVQRIYDAMRDHPARAVETRWIGSGNLVVRRALFEQVSGFDASLEACEDVDLCRRLRASGARLIANPAMVSIHKGDPRTLSALFFGELWRGRDNLRVSLRPPVAWTDMPSMVIPVVWLAASLAAIAALATGNPRLTAAALGAGALSICTTAGRAVTMIRRASLRPRTWLQALAVAAVYDCARALSLVWRATHRTRSASDTVVGAIRG